MPLADTDAVTFSGMLNLVGAEGFSGKVVYAGLEEVLRLPKTYIHLYGKTETKPGRKMGHINVLAESREELMEKLVKIKRNGAGNCRIIQKTKDLEKHVSINTCQK